MQLAVHTKIEIPDGLIDEYTRRGASVRVGSHSHSFSGHGGWGAAREGSKFQNRNYRGLNVLSGKNWSGGQALAQDQAYDVGGSEHGSKEQSESDVERFRLEEILLNTDPTGPFRPADRRRGIREIAQPRRSVAGARGPPSPVERA